MRRQQKEKQRRPDLTLETLAVGVSSTTTGNASPISAGPSRLAIGLISGTSVDGIDTALVRLTGPPDQVRVLLLAFATIRYPLAVRRKIQLVAGGEAIAAREISELNFLLGKLFGDAALKICRRGGVSPERLAVIGSHGQTIFHHGRHIAPPNKNGGKASPSEPQLASTLQIGEPAEIAERTRVPVVADFRTADLAAGGEGAPLVPMADYLLLRDKSLGTAALNIGGIANVTVVPAGAGPEEVFGFDTGPGNMLMDGLVRHATGGQQSFDESGQLAGQGKILNALLARLLRLPFFRRWPPKSAGREQFGQQFLTGYFLRGRAPELPESDVKDLLRTATELTAATIGSALRRFVLPKVKIDRLIVSGGGAHNQLLMRRLVELLPEVKIQPSDDYGLPVDAKEAIAFAVLADRTLHGLAGNLPKVTGARRSVVLGKIARP
jgi:anhydro-N-acetylmuramic acid kinase